MNAPKSTKPARKALVIGGSLGGLFAANLLLRFQAARGQTRSTSAPIAEAAESAVTAIQPH